MKPTLTASTCRAIAEGIFERTEAELRNHIEQRLLEGDKPYPEDLLDTTCGGITTHQVLGYFGDPRIDEHLLSLYKGLIDSVIDAQVSALDYYRDVRAVGL